MVGNLKKIKNCPTPKKFPSFMRKVFQIYSGWALMGAPHKVIFVFHHTKLRKYSIITGNTDWNSRDLSPSVDTK
jgi:hypothetical protein